MSKINYKHINADSLSQNQAGMKSTIDEKHFFAKKDNLFSKLELTQMKKILYRTKEEEFVGAQIWNQTNEWMAGAKQVGFNRYEGAGEARAGATGAKGNDIPLVSGKLTEEFQNAVDLEIGIEYTQSEIDTMQARNSLGRGAVVNITKERSTTARQSISRAFDRTIFKGLSNFKISGLLTIIPGTKVGIVKDNNSVHYETVKTRDTKVLWTEKSGLNIIKDLNRAKFDGIEGGNILQGDTLLLDPVAYSILQDPYSDLSGRSIMNFINDNKMFKNIVRTNAITKKNTDRDKTFFLVADTSEEVAEIPVLRPITIWPSAIDWLQMTRQLISMRTAGLLVKNLAGFYFADGHVD